ncbi:asparagine synthase (glutamine-hydrolyzing) [Halalkalibacter sp. AB-rgal2]|uniref:asparagine synthase (glutamine-hydrolyzing) n=1 Tax=Halalkalibacter sp. AB-rgal2 TaxID=3242695 RepID=UPI00359ED7F9
MCGFVVRISGQAEKGSYKKMMGCNRYIHHRGPDQIGYLKGDYMEMAFSRLSIIDVEGGNQPLTYEDHRYSIVFNGEIYNYIELRDELKEKGKEFQTSSDTEVILALYSEIGMQFVEKLRGMFAFVIWDKMKNQAIISRDRFGIKPLYYHEDEKSIIFSSEKKCITQRIKDGNLNKQALHHYFSFQYVPEPYTMTDSILRVEPGMVAIKEIGKPLQKEFYWKPILTTSYKTEDDWIKDIKNVVCDSVEKHMRSDVAVGCFLSGGIDSTIITTLASEHHPGIKAFSIGFEEDGYSEVDVAEKTAKELDIEHHVSYLSAHSYKEELPKLLWHLDDPFADPAAVPLYFVAKEASQHVKVVLSGEGADELFGGYTIYREPISLSPFNKVPTALKPVLAKLAYLIPEGVKGKSWIERGITPLENRYIGNAFIFKETEKMKLLKSYNSIYTNGRITDAIYQESVGEDPIQRMQHIDLMTWLRGDILMKADKMTMAHSLELRVPFLDSYVFEVASQLPPEAKTAKGTTKYLLRKAFADRIPAHVVARRKLGFPVPLRVWLRNEWFDWVEELIRESEASYLLNKSFVRELLYEHAREEADHSRKLWTVICFIIWHQVFIEKKYDIEKWLTDVKDEDQQPFCSIS